MVDDDIAARAHRLGIELGDVAQIVTRIEALAVDVDEQECGIVEAELKLILGGTERVLRRVLPVVAASEANGIHCNSLVCSLSRKERKKESKRPSPPVSAGSRQALTLRRMAGVAAERRLESAGARGAKSQSSIMAPRPQAAL